MSEVLIKYLLKNNPYHQLCFEFNDIVDDFQRKYDKILRRQEYSTTMLLFQQVFFRVEYFLTG